MCSISVSNFNLLGVLCLCVFAWWVRTAWNVNLLSVDGYSTRCFCLLLLFLLFGMSLLLVFYVLCCYSSLDGACSLSLFLSFCLYSCGFLNLRLLILFLVHHGLVFPSKFPQFASQFAHVSCMFSLRDSEGIAAVYRWVAGAYLLSVLPLFP